MEEDRCECGHLQESHYGISNHLHCGACEGAGTPEQSTKEGFVCEPGRYDRFTWAPPKKGRK